MEGTGTSRSEDTFRPKWRYRRAIVFSTLLFDAAVISFILYGWFQGLADNAVLQIIAAGVLARSVAVIGSYVFGAAWEDKNIMNLLWKR